MLSRMDMFIVEDPEKALIDFGHQRLEALEVALEENRKILMEEVRFEAMEEEMMVEKMVEEEMRVVEDSKEVEDIATAATLQLFNLEKLVEEEVTETGNNLDYIENLLDKRVGGEAIREVLEREEDQVESGKEEQEEIFETLKLALSEDDEEEGSKDESVDEENLVFTQENVENLVKEKDEMKGGKGEDEEEEMESSSRKRKREEEEEEVEGKRSAKRFCGWRTWVADIFTSWFNFNFGYFVELYNGLSDVFVHRTT